MADSPWLKYYFLKAVLSMQISVFAAGPVGVFVFFFNFPSVMLKISKQAVKKPVWFPICARCWCAQAKKHGAFISCLSVLAKANIKVTKDGIGQGWVEQSFSWGGWLSVWRLGYTSLPVLLSVQGQTMTGYCLQTKLCPSKRQGKGQWRVGNSCLLLIIVCSLSNSLLFYIWFLLA